MAFALLPFFQFFRGTPHQLAAVKQLEESLPEGVLDEDAEWFEAWKASGIEQQIWTPYYHQLDNESGYGVRECFSSAAAMVASFYGKVSSDDYYNKIRERIGDTTMIDVQVKTLRSLDLNVDFLQTVQNVCVLMQMVTGI